MFQSKVRPLNVKYFLSAVILLSTASFAWSESASYYPKTDHYDGIHFFNPADKTDSPDRPPMAASTMFSAFSRWVLGWAFGQGWNEWPEYIDKDPGPAPVKSLPGRSIRVTWVGHSTFLIQFNGLNILTDPIWSQRCSPFAFAGPMRHQPPGIRFEDLPPIDAVLISHNHYDHLDLWTLEQLADRFHPRVLTPLKNRKLIELSGLSQVEEFDWWQSVQITADTRVTIVPARHFSSRTLWDRNEALWGAFVISGPFGSLFYAGDTGYGPHFAEINRRFGPMELSILPIAPFNFKVNGAPHPATWMRIHMNPQDAVQAHRDLKSRRSLACHFQTFQLGGDGFEDAVRDLDRAVKEKKLSAKEFTPPPLGEAVDVAP